MRLAFASGTVVGLADVVSEPRPDKNDAKSWVADFKFVSRAKRPVTLREIKESHKFDDWSLVRMGRLSTMQGLDEFANPRLRRQI